MSPSIIMLVKVARVEYKKNLLLPVGQLAPIVPFHQGRSIKCEEAEAENIVPERMFAVNEITAEKNE